MIHGTGPTAIYVRISDDPELARLGVQRQERECRELATRLGWPVGKVYEDDDRSAFKKNVARRAYLELLADIKAGKVRRLIAWHPDRMHRQPSELETFIQIVDAAKVEIATVQSGELDLSTPDGRMVARITGSVAARESEHKSERVKASVRDRKRRGKWLGGPRPFGWESGGVIERTEEVAQLREAKDRILKGEPLHAITADWNRRGIRGTRSGGKVILSAALKRMLTSPRVVGRYEADEGAWAPIFTEDEWQHLKLILSNRRGTRRPAGRYLLTGEILKCGLCGGPMYGHPGGAWQSSGKAVPNYSCRRVSGRGCGRINIQVERADEMVMVRLVDHLNSKEFKARMKKYRADNPGINKAVLESARIQGRMTELAAAYGAGSVTMAEWMAAKRELEPKMKAANVALEAAQAQLAGLNELARFAAGGEIKWTFGDKWRELDLDARRRAVLALVQEVKIQPHRGPYQHVDPDRVEVTFRA